MTALVFERFTVGFGDREVFAVDGRVDAGAVVVVTGDDGAEVSAVLSAVVAALDPDAPPLDRSARARSTGSVRIEDLAAGRPPLALLTRDHDLLGALTATENVGLGLLAHAPSRRRAERGRPDRDDRITDALDAVGVPPAVRTNLAEQLSGGQQQRVALARALAVDAGVTVLDDPTSELDPASGLVVLHALEAAADRGGIVVVGRSSDDEVPASAILLRIGHRGRHAPA